MSDVKKEVSNESLMGGCLIVLIAAPLIVYARAYCLSLVWGWHVMPVFGLAVPGLARIYGLVVFGQLAFGALSPRGEPKRLGWREEAKWVVVSTAGLGLLTLIAWWLR